VKWRRLGRVFDPREVRLPVGDGLYAQAPKAVVFEDFVRVYFSTRSREASSGMYRSHVAFADFDKSFEHLLGVSHGTVLAEGCLGSFDEHGVFPMSVVRHGDLVYGYTTGWSRRRSVSVETGIGLAVSRDGGATFVRVGDGPVLSASVNEPFLVGDGFVRIMDGVFHMWYMFGTAWKRDESSSQPERVYKLGHAVSADGVSWRTEDGRRIVPDSLGEDECQALPTVFETAGGFHLYFCYRHPSGFRSDPARGYRIGAARSLDGASWEREAQDPLSLGPPGSWDADMQCYPDVVVCGGRTYLLYNGNAFGRYGFGAAVLE
jgi:hypothetical protein